MKKVFVILFLVLTSLVYADNWKSVENSLIQTTIGYSIINSKVQYICEWIKGEEYNGITLHVRSNRGLTLGKYKTSCIIVGNYVFPSEAVQGFGENSLILRFKSRKLFELIKESEQEIMVKIAGYEFTTKINTEYGEFKD